MFTALQYKYLVVISFCYSLADSTATITSLRAEIRMYENSIKELENLNQIIRDEHQALQLAFASLEDKLRKAQVCLSITTIIPYCNSYNREDP